MRRLNRTVMAGGVIHPAGTRETDDLAQAVTNPAFWDDDEPSGDPVERLDPTSPVTAELREACEYLVERHLADPEASVTDLLFDALSVFGADAQPGSKEGTSDALTGRVQEIADAATGDAVAADAAATADPAPVVRINGDYDDHKVAALNAEIELRNEGRDAPDRILPTGKNKPDLVAALTADDEN